jgi:hypothetical protein
MGTTYEIWCGGHLVAFRNTASSPRQAVLEYLRSQGCNADEIPSRGRGAVTWQGTVYRAVRLGSAESSPAAVARWATQEEAAA